MIAVPISKTRFRCVVAFVVAWGVANTGASAATSMTQSNGLQLEMSIVGAATWTDVEVVCRITNISAVVVQFSIVTRAAGFVPELLFREGTNVPMTSGFRKLITDFDGSFKLASGQLQPGASVYFRFKILDAFQLDDPTGCNLRLKWDPGIDGFGNRRDADKNLVAELKVPDLPSLQRAKDRDLTVRDVPETRPMDDRIGTKNAPGEHHDSADQKQDNKRFEFGFLFWAIVAGAVFAGLLAVKVVRGKRATSDLDR